MPDKSVTLSARLPVEDVEFLNKWVVDGAESSSEKLRKAVKDARKRDAATHDYKSALRLFQQVFSPATEFVRESELQVSSHSELLARVHEWLPELAAYLYSAEGLEEESLEEQLKRLEQGVARRVVIIVQSMLQLSITSQGLFYEQDVLSSKIEPVLDLSDVIRTMRDRSK